MFNEEPYSHIIDNIYIGNIQGLESNVIDCVEQVISLVPNKYKKELEDKNIQVYEIPFNDNPDENIIEYSELVYELINSGKKTFIHCFAGKSRSVACVIYYLMKKHNMKLDVAHKFVANKRPTIDINFGFYAQLYCINYTKTVT